MFFWKVGMNEGCFIRLYLAPEDKNGTQIVSDKRFTICGVYICFLIFNMQFMF